MIILNKKRLGLGLVCVLAVACMLTACGKNKPSGNTNIGSRPVTTAAMLEQQTVSNMRVFIKDITAYAGEEIDYIGAIESAENLEINRSMIYVDSSAVDSNTPGTYKVIYTLDYLGSSVSNSVKVTILENPEKETTTAPAETTTEIATETATTEATSGEEASGEQSTGSGETTSEGETTGATGDGTTDTQTGETQTVSSTEPITAIVEQELPAAEITLSSGRVVSFKMTSARYITETYTVDTYFEEDGMTFLNSELRVVFNTGEEQVVETVVTRVQPQSTTAATQ